MSSNLYFRNDTILLYVQFKDSDNNPASQVNSPQVRVLHEINGQIIDDLSWTNMIQMSTSEYVYSLQIAPDADYGFREVIYSGIVDGMNATVIEDFHIIPNNEIGQDVIRVYGLVNQLRTGYSLVGVNVNVTSVDGTEIFSQSFTKDDGSWECYLYPGQYVFSFNKVGFNPQTLTVQINDESTELAFSNIALEAQSDMNKGNGIYSVGDKYQLKDGTPLNGLMVNVLSIFNLLGAPIAQDVTDDDGKWETFLDPSMYLVKVAGTSLEEDFSYTFRLKVNNDSSYQFENLSENVAVPADTPIVGKGDGSTIVTDNVYDGQGNAIIDVQVNVFYSTDTTMANMIAQDYTDFNGKWEVYLDSGTYLFEFYHPDFDSVTETRTIN